MRSKAVVCLALAMTTIAAYWPVFGCGFVTYDDPPYVARNPRVLEGLTWSGWWYAWTSRDCSNWHPLTWLSLELDATFWGINPVGYHSTNLALHTLNTLLLFCVLNRMTGGFYRSACVAAFFAVHPLHVESVAWIAERKDVLSTFFLLLTVAAYIRYAARPSTSRYLTVFGLFVLGLLAKPMLVTLPFLLLLLDVWPLDRWKSDAPQPGTKNSTRRRLRSLVIEKVPLFGAAFLDGLMTMNSQKNTSLYLADVTLDARLANAFRAYLWYLEKTLAPTGLIVFYPHPEFEISWLHVGSGAVLVIGISILALMFLRTKPHVFVGWTWFVVSLLPVIGLVQVGGQAYADRYAYVPHIGLFTAIVWEAQARLGGTKRLRVSCGLAAASALIACAVLTRFQVGYWEDSQRLWTHAVTIDPGNYVAHGHLADLNYQAGNFTATIEQIEQSMRSKRTASRANVYCNWGACLNALNRPAEAEEKFREALHIDPNFEIALGELAKLLTKDGRPTEAAEFSARYAVIQREKQLMHDALGNPETEASQLVFGEAQARIGNHAVAVSHFEHALRLAPKSAAAHAQMGLAQIQLKRFKEAKSNLTRALELNPKQTSAHIGMSKILEQENDIPAAKDHLNQALLLNPNEIDAKRNLERLSNE